MSSDPSTTSPQSDVILWQAPPRTIGGIVRRLGPGLIIAASIVGSGELIGTTKTGAEAGFSLLWLIVLACVVKVFAQVEFGRFAITTGETAIDGLNEVPGPRWRVNWLVWYWVFMFLCSTSQLGGIVGVVGQTLALSFPLEGDYQQKIEQQVRYDNELHLRLRKAGLAPGAEKSAQPGTPAAEINRAVEASLGRRVPPELVRTRDDIIWAAITTVVTALMLVAGRYGLVQNMSALLVAGFTAVTVFNVIALQSQPDWAVSSAELLAGLRFELPGGAGGTAGLATALATFGIIGVGAAEMIAYPYWCLEKGYARFTGPRDNSPAWAERARGWLRVMRWDCWCSMVIYTFATVAFYLLGAGVLHRLGLVPSDAGVIQELVQIYTPIFGAWAGAVFLFGAFAVLYSTFFVATAGNARMAVDVLRLFGLTSDTPAAKLRWLKVLCGLLPFVSLGIYVVSQKAVTLVLLSGLAQAVMLPMLGAAALYFRYRRCDPRLAPGRVWDFLLWLSLAGLIVAAIGGIWADGAKIFRRLFGAE